MHNRDWSVIQEALDDEHQATLEAAEMVADVFADDRVPQGLHRGGVTPADDFDGDC